MSPIVEPDGVYHEEQQGRFTVHFTPRGTSARCAGDGCHLHGHPADAHTSRRPGSPKGSAKTRDDRRSLAVGWKRVGAANPTWPRFEPRGDGILPGAP